MDFPYKSCTEKDFTSDHNLFFLQSSIKFEFKEVLDWLKGIYVILQ